MSTNEITSLFKIQYINQQEGICEVRFINPHGPIETKEKTLEDFIIEEDIPTGDLDNDGSPITIKHTYMSDENPNGDVIWTINLPVDTDGNFYSNDKFLQFLAEQYPKDIFDDWLKRKNATESDSLQSLVNTEHQINIVYDIPANNLLAEEESV